MSDWSDPMAMTINAGETYTLGGGAATVIIRNETNGSELYLGPAGHLVPIPYQRILIVTQSNIQLIVGSKMACKVTIWVST